MKGVLIFTSLIAALMWSCNSGGEEEVVAEQNFTVAYGTYCGPAKSMQADSLILTFEAGSFTEGRPVGEAKRLTVTCWVPTMFENERYLDDGTFTAAAPDGQPPLFIPGTLTTNPDGSTVGHGTYLEAWASASSRAIALFTGGSIEVAYSTADTEYTITASLSDAAGNIFNTTYVGELNLTVPEPKIDETPRNLIAMYYGDGDSTSPQRWLLDVFGDNTGGGAYSGLLLDIHANRVFLEEGANTLQEGEYRIGSGDATGTYLPGSYENGTLSGSYYYVMDKGQNITGGIYITGGTFTVERDTSNERYTLTANIRGRNIEDGAEDGKVIKYEGNPLYLDMSGQPEP